MLQVARFLYKSYTQLKKGVKLAPSVKYLEQLRQENLSVKVEDGNLSCPRFINDVIGKFSCISVRNMAKKLQAKIKEGYSEKEVWNKYLGISLTEAAGAHSLFIIHESYLNLIDSIQV